jgi:mycothiol synthase
MTTPAVFQELPFAGEGDLPAVCDLLNTCNAVDQLREEPYATMESMRRQWLEDPDLDPAQDIRLWWDEAGRVVALGRLAIAPPDEEEEIDASLLLRVHPETRNHGLERAVVEWAAARARAVGAERGQPVGLRAGQYQSTPEYIAYRRGALEALGFRPVRYGYKMARPLERPIPAPQFPPGYTVRTLAGEPEYEQWVDIFNWSFIDHWNHHPMTLEQHRHLVSGPHYRPDGDLIAVAADGTFAAFCHCEINDEDNRHSGRNEGWIDALGTRRGHRQIGLGRAILLAGMHWLKGQGLTTAVLYVDAENPTGALRLYESVGFAVVSTVVYHKKNL